MALSDPRTLFGIHSFTPYNRDTGMPDWGIFKVISGMNINLSADFIRLYGGSSSFPWDVEKGVVTAEATGDVRAYDDSGLELFLGATATANAAEASGNVGSIANKYGTSVVDATTGIASVAATGSDEGDLKFGKYVVKAASATTVNIYCLSDIDFLRGNDAAYQDDTLLVNASPITIPDTGATVAVAELGITFTGGSGTVAMTSSDTAIFEIRNINSGSSVIEVGKAGEVVEYFGCVFYAEKRSDGSMWEIDAAKCMAYGFPVNMTEKEFAAASCTINMLFDSAENRVFRARAIKG